MRTNSSQLAMIMVRNLKRMYQARAEMVKSDLLAPILSWLSNQLEAQFPTGNRLAYTFQPGTADFVTLIILLGLLLTHTWLVIPQLLTAALITHVGATWLAHNINLGKLQAMESQVSLCALKGDMLKKQKAKLAAGLDEVCSLQAEVAGLERVAAEVQQLKAKRATLEERAAALQTTAARVAAAERRLSHLPALQSRVALLRARHRLQARLKWAVQVLRAETSQVPALQARYEALKAQRAQLQQLQQDAEGIQHQVNQAKALEAAAAQAAARLAAATSLHNSLSAAAQHTLNPQPRQQPAPDTIASNVAAMRTDKHQPGQQPARPAAAAASQPKSALQPQPAQPVEAHRLQAVLPPANGVSQAAGATRAAGARPAAVSSTAAQVPLTAAVAGSACQDAAAAASVVGTGAGIAMPGQAAKLGSAQTVKAAPAASLTAAPQPSTATACLAASAAALGSAHYAAKPGAAKPVSQSRPLADVTALPASQTVAQPAAQPASNPPGLTATPGCHMGGQGRDEAPLSLSHQSYQSLTFDTPAGGSHLFGWGMDKEAYFTPMAMAFTPGPEAAAFAAALKAGMAVPGKSSCSGGTDLAHASRDQDYDNSQAQSRAQPLGLDPVCR
ncbi:hypothetical protein V8C86DRAFT_2739007 [Haematococcus lacustris]